MKIDKQKLSETLASAKEIILPNLSKLSCSWTREEKLNDFIIEHLRESIFYDSNEQRDLILDYMREHGVQDQIERDFAAVRQVIDGVIVYKPRYETWSAAEALCALLTYRNSSKLSQKTVKAHRSFITEVAGELVGTGDIQWVYKSPESSAKVIDRGYSLSSFPLIRIFITTFQATHNLLLAEKEKLSRQDYLNKSLQEIEDNERILADCNRQLSLA
jgi:hypothetical protein